MLRRPGVVSLLASAGGWREARREFVVYEGTPATVLEEDWSGPLDTEWRPFGDPLPEITTGPGGRQAFWSRGDGWFHSGVYSRRAFNASGGLGVEVELSTPLPGPRPLYMGMVAWLDSAALAAWDHRTGTIPAIDDACLAVIPKGGGETVADRGRIRFYGSDVALAEQYRSGTWYTVRLQVFPDGRCGLALNGRAVARNEGRARAWIGQSESSSTEAR